MADSESRDETELKHCSSKQHKLLMASGDCWNSLPPDLQRSILARVDLRDIFRARAVCKRYRDVLERKTFHQARACLRNPEFSLSPLVFFVENGQWHMVGFDHQGQVWRKLPPLKGPIPAPHLDLFKDYLVAGHAGLMCVNVGKASEAEKIIVCNPLTGQTKILPPLEFSRHPVVMHVHVELVKKNGFVTSPYRIIAIGSAANGTESLSRKTEVYDSGKGYWVTAGDVPGTDFSLNDFQTGVYCERQGLLLCVGCTVNGSKGILAFDVKERKWSEDWIYTPAKTAPTVHFAIAQLVECSNEFYLFSQQEAGRNVTHCIDRLDLDSGGGYRWTRCVTRPRPLSDPRMLRLEMRDSGEYTSCVPLKDNKLCIFNTIERTGVVYDMLNGHPDPENYQSLPAPPPNVNGVMFHSLNPVSYACEPSFAVTL